MFGIVLSALGGVMPGRRSLRVWTVVGGATLVLLLVRLLSEFLTGVRDTVLSELEQRELWDTATLAAGLCLPAIAGFVVGVVMRARALTAASRKAPIAPLPSNL